MSYFRHYWEAPDDTGSAPSDDVAPDTPEDGATAAVDAPEAPVEAPVTFTAEQLAEHLPQFGERFLAHHDPAKALELYGERDRNVQAALTRYTQGAPTDEDVETLRESGYEIPEPEAEQVEPIWGAPWADPSTYEDLTTLAQSDPGRALAFIDKQPDGTIDPTFRQQVLTYWASPEGGNDPAAMVAYEREKAKVDALTEAKTYAEQLRDEMRAEFGDVRSRHEVEVQKGRLASVDLMAANARTQIPEFAEHEKGVIALVTRNVEQDPTYLPRLIALPPEQQIQHLTELTGAAAWMHRPEAEAEAQAEADAAEAAKAGAAGVRGRGANGTGNDSMSQAKREHLASFQRLDGVEVR